MIPCNKIEESITNIKNILADKCNILKNTDILLIIETIEAIERCLKDPNNLNSDIVLYTDQFKTESEQLIVRNNIGAININDVKTFIENNSSYLSEQLGYEVISNKVDNLNSNSKIRYPNVYAVKKALEELSLIPGPKGEDGLDGTKWYNSTGVPSINLGKIGDYYINLNTMSVFYKTSNIEWLFIGALKGDTGETGETGPQGPIGLTGEKGEKGDKGDTGEQGIQGIKGEQGPKGDTGDTGPQGEPGPKGDIGPQGEQGIQGEQGPEVDLSDYAKREELDNYSLITHKHTYDELLDKPILFSGSYNDLTNKPTLFSGDYNDLANKPTIPTFVESVENQNITQPNIMFWTGTQAEYDSITVPNPDTLYFIKP